MVNRLAITDVSPAVDGGRLPARAVVGEHIPIKATVWREGHEALAAAVVWRQPDSTGPAVTLPMVLADAGTDSWTATAVPDRRGMWTYRVEAWSDPWATWRHAVLAKLADGWSADRLGNELESGARLLERHAQRAEAPHVPRLRRAADRLRDELLPLRQRVADALSEEVGAILAQRPVRELLTRGDSRQIWVDRPLALAGAWYELFPRSTGGRDSAGRPVHGTFATAAEELPRIAGMGYDVVYLPPIHPIGSSHRKGRNNGLTAGPDDVGSPWAIGSAAGGHDAVHPDLGTLADFDAFVDRAHTYGLDVALDLAFQCSPDHPWVRSHPEWFTTRPDGTIAYAENPPKAYQDIYPLNFDNDPIGLYAELLRIVLFWMDHGVSIFRVDNPHTKPVDFWHWLIRKAKQHNPEVLFLAEAFTRPAVLQGLAKVGFTQSYTYFTWRTTKQELTEYFTELSETIHFLHPNAFVTTPDILPVQLQQGDHATFALRAALAATLSPTWGVYSGYELYEHQALHEGGEEYLDSEKYELRPRDFAGALAAGSSLQPWLTELNRIRRRHPALRQLRDLRFHDIDNDALLAFSKTDPATGNSVLTVINLNPEQIEEGFLTLTSLPGAGPDGAVTARDAFNGETVRLESGTIKIDPADAVARILTWSSHG